MQYSKKIMCEFERPANVGRMKNPDGLGKVGNPVCGDVLWVYIKVKNKKIVNISFQTFGCVVAVACSSVLTKLAKGKTLKEAEKITRNDVIKALGGKVPPIKLHCSVLAADALKAAIKDYYKKQERKIKETRKNKNLKSK